MHQLNLRMGGISRYCLTLLTRCFPTPETRRSLSGLLSFRYATRASLEPARHWPHPAVQAKRCNPRNWPKPSTPASGSSMAAVLPWIARTRPSSNSAIREALTSDDLVDRAPSAAFAVLLEQGRYLGSVSTFYRVLRADDQVKERRRLARDKPRQRPELVATRPGQVYSWSGGRGHRSPRLPQIPA